MLLLLQSVNPNFTPVFIISYDIYKRARQISNAMEKRITIFAGHYGSGKTNLALNYAFMLKKKHEKVILCDMDIVNPYFRTKDSSKELEDAGIRLISPEYANTNIDLPSLPAEVAVIFSDNDSHVVIDVGGDDSGAVALGQYAEQIKKCGYEMFLVFNERRYLTRTSDEAVEIMNDIEAVSHLKFTGIANNTNLGGETTPDIIYNGEEIALNLSKQTGLPLRFTSYREDIELESSKLKSELLPITIFRKPGWFIF